MNRVYKVIWSKAKHCYVVTSEIARSVTKSASSARSAGRKGAAVLAMAALLFTAGGVLGEAANVTDVTVNKPGNVITVTKDDKSTDIITINNVDYAKEATNAYGDGDGHVIKNTYVKIANARVGADGEYVKKANTVGKNLSALDTNLSALDKQVKKNTEAVAGVVEAGEKVGEKLLDLDTQVKKNAAAVTAEETARKQADQNNLKIEGDDGVISKVTGNDGTKSSAVNKLVLNKDGNNQITMDENGIKVGKNSTVIASDGVFAGGDTATDAKAALNANGSIKGANGDFTVDENGNVASKATITGETVTDGKGASMRNGTVNGKTLTDGIATITNGTINTTGTVTGGTVTSTGNISALGDIHASGNITGANASIQGALTAGSATITGGLTAGGAIQGTSISDGTATMKNGDITGVKNLSAETITTHGDLTVNGKLNMDEIDMTKNGIKVDDNNVTASTKVAAGEITSYKKATNTKDGGSEKESAFDYDEKGTSTWAKATDADGKWNKSILTVEGTGIKSTATDGTNKTYTKQTAVDIKNTAKNGTITNDAMDVLNKGANSVINKVGDNKVAVKTDSVKAAYGSDTYTTWNGKGITSNTSGNMRNSATNITNKAEEKLSNSAAEIENSASKSITDKVGENTSWKMTDGKISESIDNGTASNKGNTTVDGTKRIITNGEGTGTYNQTATSNNISLKNAAGDTFFTKSESLNGEKTSVKNSNGSSTINQSAESIVNFVKNSEGTTKTEQSAKDITNIAKDGTITNNAMDVLNKGANSVINKVGDNKVAVKTDSVKAAYGSDTYTTWNGKGITSNTSGNMRNSATNITNKAEEKLSNSAAEIENSASKSITDKVGENTSWKMTDGKISESIDNGTASNKGNTTVDGTKRIITNGEGTGTYNQTATSNNISLKNAAGDTFFTKSESLNGEKTSVKNSNGSSTINQSAESIVNFVKNSEGTTKTEQSAKDITNIAKDGTITNNAMDVLNKGANSVINKVGDNKVAVKTDRVKVAYGSDTYTTWNDKGITNNAKDKTVKTTAKDIKNTATGDITNTATDKIISQIGDGSAVKSEMTADGITNTAKDGTIYNKSKDILNEASGDIINWADGEIGNVATKITNITGKNTVISDNDGTTFENEDAKTPFVEGGEVNTKITGNKVETGKVLTDDLTVRGTSEFVGRADFRDDVYVDNNLTVAKETRTDTLYVDHDGYVGGNLNVDGNIETHDAVLSADSRQVVTGRQLYQTNERVDRLDNRIKKVGANAAALAALRPGDFNPDDKFSIAAGFGSYRNANAAALGLFYRPNENVLLSLGTSFGDGENMVNAGVSVKFGRGKSMAERRKEMADEVSSMRDEMRSQDERIAELEEMLKKQSELIEKLSKES